MPFVRISILRGKSRDYLEILAGEIHQAMVETFNVPPADRFQIIHQMEPGELIFDRNYLAGPRSDDYVLVHITVGKPRSAEVKKAFYARMAERLEQSIGLKPADLMIVISTSAPEDWSFGDGRAQMTEPGWEKRAMGDAA